MPPLSAYTPFESLLFFQCLASLASRPTSFADISDTLRKNRFVKENDAFDGDRLSPEALEELYTTLLQEGVDSSIATTTDSANANLKKRKINNNNNNNAAQSHTVVVPALVSQLYARYKDRVTKEIRDEEQKYREIRDEIDRLQKDQLDKPVEPAVQNVVTTDLLPDSAKALPVPSTSDRMDIDTKDLAEEDKTNVIPPNVNNVQGVKEIRRQQEAAPITSHQTPKPAIPLVPPSKPQEEGPLPKPETVKQQGPSPAPAPPAIAPARALQPQPPTPIAGQQPASVPAATPKPAPKATPPIAREQPLAPQPAQISPAPPKIEVKVPPPNQLSRPPSHTPSRTGPSPSRNQPALPPGSTIVFQAQQAPSLPTTPTVQRHIPQVGENVARQGVPPIGTPIAPHILPGQHAFQQWSPHPPPPHSAASVRTPGILPAAQRPIMPQQAHHAQPEFPNAVPASVHGPLPATPGAQAPFVPMSAPQTPLPGTPSFRPGMKPRVSRASIDTAGSLTPWKRTPSLSISIPDTPGSPPRPQPGDVSPISDRALSPIDFPEPAVKEGVPQRKPSQSEPEKPRRGRKRSVQPPSLEKAEPKGDRATPARRGKRGDSITSTRGRARSAASREDEESLDSAAAQRKIKDEAPATPAGISEDTEAEMRPGTRRKSTVTAGPSEDIQAKGRPKRKRGVSEVLDTERDQPTPGRPSASQLIYCTRNFPRTGAPLMNDVSAHKHASIFGKPLTEREAPGYKDLIYRPQDLKTVRSALNQGNRAVAAATESFSTPIDGESPNPAATGTPSKNAAWLPKTAELIPPKAIVNSSQLEKELIRMFANAVMFNPAPERERGFGPSFPLGTANESRSSSQPWQLDEGGIFRDTREMCDDVEKAVTKWRAAERTTADDLSNKNLFTLRGNSGENAENTDSDVKG
jgi:hypothetical protein